VCVCVCVCVCPIAIASRVESGCGKFCLHFVVQVCDRTGWQLPYILVVGALAALPLLLLVALGWTVAARRTLGPG
jgi:hypothetical protein